MNIGVDACCWTNKRGFGRFTRELLKALIILDQNNDYFFFIDEKSASEAVFPERVNIIIAPTRVSPVKAASSSGRRSFKDLWMMTREVRKHKLDIFFFPAVYSYFPILNRTKVIVTIHDMTPELYPHEIFPNKKFMYFWKFKRSLAVRQAHLILTVSEHSKQEILKFCKIPESRVGVISEGPNQVFTCLPKNGEMENTLVRYQLNPSERFLLYVGGISPHKNLNVLIDAFRQLTGDACFSDLKLILVGDYQHDSFYSNYATTQQLVNKHHLEKQVIFTGHVSDKDLARLYNAAALFVLPSLQEGFGLPAVEAMACGTPVAASNLGSLPEIVGQAGCFFDPYNQAEICGVIKAILSDPEKQEKMSRYGLTRAKLFSWEMAAADLISIFDNLVKN